MAESDLNEVIKKLIEQNRVLMETLKVTMRTASNSDDKSETKSKAISNIHFEKYDEHSENWDSFIERFSTFLDVQSIEEDKKGKVLISSLSPKLFSLLKSLIAPKVPINMSFGEISDVLKKHLNPKQLVIPSRHAFLNRKQNDGESITNFIAELRTLAVPCCYPEDMLNTMLRDVFVSGLRNKAILDRLFEEDDADLEKTLNIALTMEKASIGARNIMGNEKYLEVKELNAARKQISYKENKWSNERNFKNKKNSCMRCGKNNHVSNMCKHKNTICNYCKKKGHLAVVCFKAQKIKKNKKFEQVNQIKDEENFEKGNLNETLPFYGVTVVEKISKADCETESRSPIMLSIKIDNKLIKMELDTGAAVSAMSYANFRKISNKEIRPTKLIFKTYDGRILIPMGYVNVEAEYNAQKHSVKLYIVKERVDTLFGREWLFKFKIDWTSIKIMKSEDLDLKDDISVFQISQIETLPINARDLAKATEIDEELAPLLRMLKLGGQLKGKEVEYSLQDGCIMYGQRVCVPKKFQAKILEELHQGHLGIVKMKAIARSYIHWKNIDHDIERAVKNCSDCAKFRDDPSKARVHHWEYPSAPWERIHIDFCGPIFEHMFLVIVDAHSKWLEVYPMKTTTTFKTIECLKDCFSRFGLPAVLVSDNGPQFSSFEFQTFMLNNGIKHKTCAPFKPSSNGQAERYVHTLKQALRAMQGYPGNIRQKVNIFLMQYRKSPNLTTNHSPAMLFLKREIRTRIDLLRPDLKGRIEERIRKNTFDFRDRFFHIGDKVAIRDYRSANSKWRFGRVINKDGELHYTIDVQGNLFRRHVDQMRPAGEEIEEEIPRIPYRSFVNSPVTPGVTSSQPSKSTDESSEKPASPDDAQEKVNPPGNGPSAAVNEPAVVHEPTTDNFRTIPRRSGRIRRVPQRLNL